VALSERSAVSSDVHDIVRDVDSVALRRISLSVSVVDVDRVDDTDDDPAGDTVLVIETVLAAVNECVVDNVWA